MSRPSLAKFSGIAEKCFSFGIALTAILLPLEIVPNKLISLLSILITLLLLPYPIVTLASKAGRQKVWRSKLWIIFTLPLLAAFITELSTHASGVGLVSFRTFLVLIFRAWLIAQFAGKKHLNLFATASIVVGSLVTLFGLYQFLGDLLGLHNNVTLLRAGYSSTGTHAFPRVHSTAREPLLLASYLFIPMSILFVRILNSAKSRRLNIGLLTPMLLLFFTLDARGGLYALAAVAILVAMALRNHPSRLVRPAIAAILVVMLAGGVLYSIKGAGVLRSFVHHGADLSDPSFQNRVTVWRKFPGIFAAHPIAGVGLGSSSRYIWGSPCLPSDPPVFNNTYLTAGAELGVLGIISLLPILVLLGTVVYRAVASELTTIGSAFGLIVVAYAVQAATYEGLLNLRLWAVVALALATWRLQQEARRTA